MKHILNFSFLILISITIKSQNIIKFIVEDNIGRQDSVIFGLDFSATIGLDAAFNESNIYGTPYDSLEIRSILRDSLSYHCVTKSLYGNTGELFNVDNNSDYKIDIRPEWDYNGGRNFEFYIHSTEYPIKVIADYSQWFSGGFWYGWVGLLNSNCQIMSDEYLGGFGYDTLYILNDTLLNRIVVQFDHEVGIMDELNSNLVRLFPNPIGESTALIIESKNEKIYKSIIKTLDGRNVQTNSYQGVNKSVLNTRNLTSGFYIIQIEIGENKRVVQEKLMVR